MARIPVGEAGSAEVGDSDDFVPLPLATDLPAGTVVGEYTIDCKLGDGGMATVYGATHPLIGKKAAIKVMDPALSLDAGLVERFVLEARAVNAIGHPNIVDVFSFGRLADGRSYFVMEWLQGETLYDRMWQRRPTLDEALDILDQVCDALESAHEKGVIHRDLKPANVFLTPVRGRRDLVKLLDFGVAKLLEPLDATDGKSPQPLAPQTMTGQVVGTPDYISPEQARARKVDGKTDIYALGVMGYEMILGRRPFEADNVADVVRMHLSEPPPSPRSLWPEIPLPVEELLLAMLHKSAPRRPSPAEVRAAIRELRGTPPPLDWDALPPAPGALLPPAPRAPEAEAARSTLDVPPLQMLSRRRLRMRSGGLALFGCGAALIGVVAWKAVHRPDSAQPLSHTATAPSLGRTVPSSPTTAPSAATAAAAPPATAAVSDEGTVVVRVDAADARIDLDGQLIAQSASSARVRVGPGAHALTVTAPGRQRYSGRVGVIAGQSVEVAVHLHHEATRATPAPRDKAREAPARPRDKRIDPDYLVDPFSGSK